MHRKRSQGRARENTTRPMDSNYPRAPGFTHKAIHSSRLPLYEFPPFHGNLQFVKERTENVDPYPTKIGRHALDNFEVRLVLAGNDEGAACTVRD